MDRGEISKNLMQLLNKKLQGGENYITLLSEITGLHRKTISMKINGKREFTASELYKIGNALDIPVGDIFRNHVQGYTHPLKIYVPDYNIFSDYKTLLTKNLGMLEYAASGDRSEINVATNLLPEYLYAKYQWLGKFKLMKWQYYNKGPQSVNPVSNKEVGEEVKKDMNRYINSIQSFKSSTIILNINMMQFETELLKYFYDIEMLSGQEVDLILKDYTEVLKEFLQICQSGKELPPYDKKIVVFYSDVLLYHDIIIVDSDKVQMAVIYACWYNPVATQNHETFIIFRNWFNALLRSSHIISMSDAKQCLEFFNKQHGYIKSIRESMGL